MNSETIKVLLIDEDEDDYIQTCELFSLVKVGRYAVEWASSYEEGLTVAGRREHHVCLVDYRLGERSGVELIREARQSRLSTPMILFTGQGDHDLDVEAMEAGATDYLIKDETSPARLERTIRYAVQLNIERCRAEEELGAYAEKQTVVAEIGRLALTGGELEDLFDQAVSLVARTLGVEYCKILELLPESDAFILRAGVGWKEEYPSGQAAFSVGKESQAGFTLLSDEPVVVEDMRTETRFSGPTLPHEHEVVSGMSVTIRGLERPYGVLGAHSASVRRFATDDVSFLRAVANVLAEAIDRKRAEVSLRQSESQFRALFENALDAVLIADDGGAYVDANPAACSLLGVSYDEVIGRTISDFTEQDAKAETPRIWEQFLKEGTMFFLRSIKRLFQGDDMTRLLGRTNRVLLAAFGMLLVGGAVAFAQQDAALAQIFTSPAKAVALALGRPVVQEIASSRPLVKLFLTGAIERDSKTIPVEKAGPVTPGEVVSFTMSSVNEGSAPAREYRAIGQIPRNATFVAGSAVGDSNTRSPIQLIMAKSFLPIR